MSRKAWPATKSRTAMASSPLPGARPWTPPDVDAEAGLHSPWIQDDADAHSGTQSDSGYFGDVCDSTSTISTDTQDRWPQSPSTSPELSHAPAKKTSHRRPHDSLRDSNPHGLGFDLRPYTPTNTTSNAPQFPYTPDSARMPVQRSRTYDFTSPPPSMPWDQPPPQNPAHTSPVQNALFSCLNNLERLIETNQPNPTQMEYIISQFEAITSYLSAPESQSKQSDDHLFAELEPVVKGEKSASLTKEEAEAYVQAVGKYIVGVRDHVEKMKARLDEMKELNDINSEIIRHLHRQLRAANAAQSKEAPAQPVEPEKPKRKGFWSAVAEALDQFGDMFYEC